MSLTRPFSDLGKTYIPFGLNGNIIEAQRAKKSKPIPLNSLVELTLHRPNAELLALRGERCRARSINKRVSGCVYNQKLEVLFVGVHLTRALLCWGWCPLLLAATIYTLMSLPYLLALTKQ